MEFPAAYGGYTLLASLGQGGMAEVFLARKAGPGGFAKLLVIKRILPNLAKEPEFISMFLDEARLAARFDHPNVVQVNDLGEAGGTHYLTMEYLAGQSIAGIARTAVARGVKIGPELVARVIADAAEGLHYVHEFKDLDGSSLGIVHRDVSPQNVFVTYEGRVKLLDFGVAKAVTKLTPQTRTGAVKGKISYMAPEQCRGEPVDRRSDVFALGVVLLELLAMRRIFKDDNELSLLRKIGGGEFQPPSQLGVSAPAALLAVCDRAMAVDPAARYPDAAAMSAELQAWLLAEGQVSGASSLSKLMAELFTEDIELRKKLLLARDDSSGIFLKVAQEKDASFPNAIGGSLTQRTITDRGIEKRAAELAGPPPGRLKPALVLVGLALASAVGVVGWLSTRPAPAPLVVSVEPKVVVPPLVVVAPPPVAPVAVDAGPAAVAVVKPSVVRPTPVPVPVAKALLSVLSEPSGCPARVDGAAAGSTPLHEVKVAPGKPVLVEVECAGFALASRTLTLSPGEAQTVKLTPQAIGKGLLTLKTSPWSVVFFGKVELGTTPLVRVELPAGTHQLKGVNVEQQLEKSFTVSIRPGETTSVTIDLNSVQP